MRAKKYVLSFIFMIIISAMILALIPSNAKADTFYNQFITECEGEDWFIRYVNEQFIKNGKRLSAITNENDPILLSIRTLSFPNAGITKLPEAISYLKNVEEVDLASNSISDISVLYSLKKVRSLDLSANALTSFDAKNFPMLENCDLSYNTLGSMPDFSACGSIKKIILENCSISSLKSIASLSKLEFVDLSYNYITDCSALGKITMSSGILDFSYNQISNAGFMNGSVGIVSVDLSYNFVTSGAEKIPSSVKTLSLSSNGISDASGLSVLTFIENLDVSGNMIKSTAFLGTLTSLKTLDISGNNIEIFPELGNLSSLEILDISHNSIKNLPVASLLTKLVSLDASYNDIQSAALANKYQSLMYFDISHNQINDIGFVSGMSRLSYIDASFNSISEVSPQLYLTAGKLRTLDLSGNSFSAAQIKNILANNFAVIKLSDTDLSGKMPDMTLYPGVSELYVSRSKLSTADINNILKKNDYTGLGLGGNVSKEVLTKLASQTDIITLDLSGTQNIMSYAADVAGISFISLDISGCSADTFDEKLLTESVKKIDLSGDKISSVPDAVLKKAARNGTGIDLRSNPSVKAGKTLLYLRNMFDFDTEFGVTLTADVHELKVRIGEATDIYSYLSLSNIYTGEKYSMPEKDKIVLSTDAESTISTAGTSFTAKETVFDFDKRNVTASYGGGSVTIRVYTSSIDIPSDGIGGKNVIYGLEAGSTFGKLIDSLNLPSCYSALVKASDGSEGTPDTVLQTGGTLTLVSGGNKVYEATVIIYGDCSGDGKVNSTDFMMVKRHIFNQSKLEGIYFEAADVYRNGSINSTDFMTIKRHIFKQSEISQTR